MPTEERTAQEEVEASRNFWRVSWRHHRHQNHYLRHRRNWCRWNWCKEPIRSTSNSAIATTSQTEVLWVSNCCIWSSTGMRLSVSSVVPLLSSPVRPVMSSGIYPPTRTPRPGNSTASSITASSAWNTQHRTWQRLFWRCGGNGLQPIGREHYGVEVAGFETFVVEERLWNGKTRNGACYRADNWELQGITKGYGDTNVRGREHQDKTLKSKKLIYCKRIAGKELCSQYTSSWNDKEKTKELSLKRKQMFPDKLDLLLKTIK